MKKYIVILILIILLLSAGDTFAKEWKEYKDKHFFIYFNGSPSFARDVLFAAERYYFDIPKHLGITVRPAVWLWDNRVKIYIYPNHESFIAATAQPEWSEGLADYREKEIRTYAGS